MLYDFINSFYVAETIGSNNENAKKLVEKCFIAISFGDSVY